MKRFTLVLSVLVLMGMFGIPASAGIVTNNLIWYSEAGNDWNAGTELLGDQAPTAPDQSGTSSTDLTYTAASGGNPAYLTTGSSASANRSVHPAYDLDSNDFTIAMWFRTDQDVTTGGTTTSQIYNHIDNGVTDAGVLLWFHKSGGLAASFQYDPGTGVQEKRISSGQYYNDGNWHLATFVRNGASGAGSLKFYVDTTEIGSEDASNGDATSPQTILLLGTLNSVAFDFNALFMYSDALTSAEVTQNYNEGAGAPIPEPVTLSILILGGVAALLRKRRRA
ncbi:MAG: PEP-CTERM sorting domain-containing protein [Actinobacteria bacterium]|nr:PEP-CTERM sorting domain-containing protein [Actinomycetota bacterium]